MLLWDVSETARRIMRLREDFRERDIAKKLQYFEEQLSRTGYLVDRGLTYPKLILNFSSILVHLS